jgi:hypothetical protein
MSTPPDDAQRTMEQKALRNVRALVDKIDTTEELDRKALRKQLTVIVVAMLVIFGVAFIGWQVMAPSEAERTVVIPPPATGK